ncbi:MAG: CoA transferase [Chloroflexi bacterium]|nr:CoA transferase [Chloroflexota bacterium]
MSQALQRLNYQVIDDDAQRFGIFRSILESVLIHTPLPVGARAVGDDSPDALDVVEGAENLSLFANEVDRFLANPLTFINDPDDPRFGEGGRDAVGLGRYAPEVKPRWERAYARFTTEDVVSLIRRHNGEAVPINDYDTLFGHPQVQALDLVEDRPASEGGLPRMLRVPWRFSWGQELAVRPSPALGEHTSSVLQRAREAGGR